jgi:hypothetical protein
MNATVKTEWDRLKQVLREYRGNILAAAFEIEMQVDRLLCEILFPASDDQNIKPDQNIPLTLGSARALRNLFDEFVLKASTMPTISFSYKIELLGNLAEHIGEVKAVVPRSLIKTLNKLRRIRNDFAHYPVTFIQNGPVGAQTFEVVLTTHKAEYKIDQAYFESTDAMFHEADEGLKAANEAMRNNLKREQDALPREAPGE